LLIHNANKIASFVKSHVRCFIYRPGGSHEVYYIDSSAEEMSVAMSETTVESTHPGTDDVCVLNVIRKLINYLYMKSCCCLYVSGLLIILINSETSGKARAF
jgi:hypothetical protein